MYGSRQPAIAGTVPCKRRFYTSVTEPSDRSLLRSTSVVGGMTLISRVLGFVRDMVLAALFGAGASMDAFLVAFKIPNFMRRLFAEGAFAQAFVPVVSSTRSTQGDEAVRELIRVVAGTFAVVLIGITVLGVLAAPGVIAVFAVGFLDDPVKFAMASDMLRLTFPYLMLISLTALCAGVLNTYGRFAVPAFAPVLLNVCLITAAWLYAPSVHALAAAVLVAGVIQLAFHLPSMAGLGLFVRPKVDFKHSQVRRVLRTMVPIMFGSSVAQINLLLDTILASLLVTGSISWLYFSDRLMEFPLGVFTIAIATVILPRLAARHAQGDTNGFAGTLDWALRLLLVIGLPAAAGLFLLAGPLIATLFQHNAFTANDTLMARASLMAYSLGFLGFSLVKVLTPGCYAREDARTPVRCGVIALVCTMFLNLVLVGVLWVLEFPAIHAGLALGTSLGAFINAGLLWRGLRHDGVLQFAPGLGRLLVQTLVALAIMAAVVLSLAGPLDWWLSSDGWPRAQRLALVIAAAMPSYFAALFLLGVRPRQLLQSPA